MSTKMRHCPFCGANNVIKRTRSKGGPELEVVECSNCGASVYAPLGYPLDAVKRWNERAIDVSIEDLQRLNCILEQAMADRMRIMLGSYDRCGTFGPDIGRNLVYPLRDAYDAQLRISLILERLFGEGPLKETKPNGKEKK